MMRGRCRERERELRTEKEMLKTDSIFWRRFLVLEGLLQHPAVELVPEASDAQFVVWTTVMANLEAELAPIGCAKVIVLDGADGCGLHPRWRACMQCHIEKRSVIL